MKWLLILIFFSPGQDFVTELRGDYVTELLCYEAGTEIQEREGALAPKKKIAYICKEVEE